MLAPFGYLKSKIRKKEPRLATKSEKMRKNENKSFQKAKKYRKNERRLPF